MTTKEGFHQINIQVPEKTWLKMESECARLNLTKGEFITRILVIHFLAQELGLEGDLLSVFQQKKKQIE
jgi:hypothetical protein